MSSFEQLIPFFIATAIFAFVPGPAILYTAAQTLARGRKAGFMAALGIHLGCYVHVIAAALGLSVIFTHVPFAYTVVKVGGAIYLIWLGIGLIRQQQKAGDLPAVGGKSARRAFFESMWVEILNPKVAIFFIAFLPQFIDPTASLPMWAQFLILGAFVNLSFSSADVIVILAADKVARRVKASCMGSRWVGWLSGMTLIGLGARLALSEK
ncbi:LysE family translocator [Kordiimonas aestuarii]|uniref:LysE family translocator n=1 Tax=Kordiimonas aestuarii TaxID=1005925 RepID=UPI0021D3047A|nr:LysE family translocator [Kordiimonas aestuarii]